MRYIAQHDLIFRILPMCNRPLTLNLEKQNDPLDLLLWSLKSNLVRIIQATILTLPYWQMVLVFTAVGNLSKTFPTLRCFSEMFHGIRGSQERVMMEVTKRIWMSWKLGIQIIGLYLWIKAIRVWICLFELHWSGKKSMELYFPVIDKKDIIAQNRLEVENHSGRETQL